MAFTFGSTTIPGTAGALKKGSRVVAVADANYFTAEGGSRIVGEKQARDITCELWLHSSYSTRALAQTALTTLETELGKTKTLTNSIGEAYQQCNLASITIDEGPVNRPPLGWMFVLTLTWRQLKV